MDFNSGLFCILARRHGVLCLSELLWLPCRADNTWRGSGCKLVASNRNFRAHNAEEGAWRWLGIADVWRCRSIWARRTYWWLADSIFYYRTYFERLRIFIAGDRNIN